MNKKIFFILFYFIFFSTSLKANSYNIFYAFGPLYSSPGSLRIGFNQWELGLLTPSSAGLNKLFLFHENWYSSFGFVIGPTVSFGFYGALGWDKKMFWGLALRFELYATIFSNAYSTGAGLLGLNWHF